MSLFSRLKTPVYKNTGSVARDHLAAERTFLSWIRTGLGFIAFGVAIERFSRIDIDAIIQQFRPASDPRLASPPAFKSIGNHEGSKKQERLLTASLLGMGFGCFAYGVGRYYSNMSLLERGLFKPSYFGAGALSLAVAGVATSATYWTTNRKQPTSD